MTRRPPDPAVAAVHLANIRRLADTAHGRGTLSDDGQLDLQRAIDEARDAGVGWTAIGDAIGIQAGNAYQRYRHRPSATAS